MHLPTLCFYVIRVFIQIENTDVPNASQKSKIQSSYFEYLQYSFKARPLVIGIVLLKKEIPRGFSFALLYPLSVYTFHRSKLRVMDIGLFFSYKVAVHYRAKYSVATRTPAYPECRRSLVYINFCINK